MEIAIEQALEHYPRHQKLVERLGEYPVLQEYVGEKLIVIENSIEQFLANYRRYKGVNGAMHAPEKPESSDVRIQCEALKYALVSMGGSRKRPLFAYMNHDLVRADKQPHNHLDDLVLIPEFVHIGSLIDDDKDDDTKKRGGVSSLYTHDEYKELAKGISEILYQGAGFFFDHPKIFLRNWSDNRKGRMGEGKANRISRLVSRTIREGFSEGQMPDVTLSKTDAIMTEDRPPREKCLDIALKKSSIPLAARVGAIMGGATIEQEENLGEIANYVGISYQLKDDIRDLDDEDIRGCRGGNKPTLPVIIAFEKAEVARELTRIFPPLEPSGWFGLFTRSDRSRAIEAVKIIRECGAVEETQRIADEYRNRAMGGLKAWGTHESADIYRQAIEYILR